MSPDVIGPDPTFKEVPVIPNPLINPVDVIFPEVIIPDPTSNEVPVIPNPLINPVEVIFPVVNGPLIIVVPDVVPIVNVFVNPMDVPKLILPVEFVNKL